MSWAVETFVCIASGPSLTPIQIDICRDKVGSVIVVNDNYKIAPWANHLYAADKHWWLLHIDDIKLKFGGMKWIANEKETAKLLGITSIECNYKPGLAEDGSLNCGNNSGYQAVNLAYKLGAKKIILLGYDMKIGSNGKLHWFGDHPSSLRNEPSLFPRWIDLFRQLAKDLHAKGINVVNCSTDTALDCFEISTLEKELS